MGEVYRADDLRLGQPVAMKFLPASLERDPAARERLLAEVRNARLVSHPNVCRVFDVGEVQGRYFLTMEYIDGEDLASLLRRIGRLPATKALEIARQLCAALAAAHERGVLHRDLKPANVMIDGRGHARITDFRLAVEAEDAVVASTLRSSHGVVEVAGTVAYLAPERFEGKPATVQTDLYALGLILYETYTGKPALSATTLDGWHRAHADSAPSHPSAIVGDIEPAVERAILRCLEKDPAKRPASATQLALSLPGGDPLAAAIAAGETPSPELVAASGEEGTLPRAQAWSRFVACFVAQHLRDAARVRGPAKEIGGSLARPKDIDDVRFRRRVLPCRRHDVVPVRRHRPGIVSVILCPAPHNDATVGRFPADTVGQAHRRHLYGAHGLGCDRQDAKTLGVCSDDLRTVGRQRGDDAAPLAYSPGGAAHPRHQPCVDLRGCPRPCNQQLLPMGHPVQGRDARASPHLYRLATRQVPDHDSNALCALAGDVRERLAVR